MAAAETAIVTAVINVGLAGSVGYGLYKIITVKGEAATASDYGRKWLAWMVAIGTLSTLPKFFRHFDAESFATWIVVIVFFGTAAFVAGWVYGKSLGITAKTIHEPFTVNSELGPENISGNIEARLSDLKRFLDKELISPEEYESKRKKILDSM